MGHYLSEMEDGFGPLDPAMEAAKKRGRELYGVTRAEAMKLGFEAARGGPNPTLWKCPKCKSLVELNDTVDHDEYHKAQAVGAR